MRFKLKAGMGCHADEDGVVYKAESIVVSDKALDVHFPDRFEKLPEAAPETVPAASSKKGPQPPQDDDNIPEEPEEPKIERVNVSEEFPEAKDADLQVFQEGKFYNVTDSSDPDKPLNKTPLKKAKVGAFLQGFVNPE